MTDDEVAAAAQEAFWARVAELRPDITTGDLDVEAAQEFDRACRRVVRFWIEDNTY